jgi:type VI secretion system secreted protein VgrG
MHRLAADTSRFRFEAGGIDFLVLSFAATEQLSTPFEVQLALAAEQEIAFETVLGQSGLLTICGRDQERLFHGIVHRLTDSGRHGRFHLYAALLKPQAALLAHRRDCRIFQHLNVPQIVAQVFTAAALPGDLYTFRLKERYLPREYCVQYRESDLDFVCRLLAAEGIFFFFEHSPSAHRMVFADSAEAYPPIAGCEQVPFNPGACLVAQEAAVIAFSRGLQITSGRYSHRDFDFKKPNLDLTARYQSNTNGLEVYDYPGGYSLPEQGSRLARVRLQCALAQQDQASGQSVVAHFLPGFTFCLTQADHPDDEIRYLLVQLTHKGEQPQVLSERSSGGQGFSYINDFTAIPATVTFRARLSDLKTPIAHRAQSAIVTGPAGEEIYTDSLGRVKVKFHWDRRKEADEHSSCWIRVSQSWAGAGWGAMHIPRIGQEVLVNFIEGDPDRPIITGRLYHGENPVPETLPDDKTVSGLKSCSTPGGRSFNQLRFEDRKGAEQLCLHAAKEMDLRVANDRRTFIGNDAHTRVHNQMHTQIGGNHHLRVKGDALTQLAASDTLIAGRDQQHRIGGDFCLEAGQSIDLNALTAMVVEAGARLTLKVGPSFVTIDDSGVSVGGPTIRFIENGRAESGRGVFVSEPEPPQSADHSRPGAPPTRTGAAAARPSAAETPCATPARIIPAVATAVREISHKLALEVAGSKKVTLTGTLRAESERGIRKGKTLAQGLGDTHRRQIFIAPLVPDRYRLYLDEGDYRIPAALGKTLPTCAEPSFSPRWETILVPIVPRSYTSIDHDRAHADYPRQGYIYIFVSSHLWRELHSDGRGAFADVDLARYKGADARPAMGNAQTAIIVPFQIGGTRPEITICYAEVQWSWAQITALGGMDPADIRHATAPRITPCTDPGKAATYRKERLQPLDLSGYPNFGQASGFVGSTGEIDERGLPLREDLFDHFKDNLPVVYLYDPLEVARRLAQKTHLTAAALAGHQYEKGHRRDIADIAQTLLNRFPKYDRHLADPGKMRTFCTEYDETTEKLLKDHDTAQLDLTSYLQQSQLAQGRHPRCVWNDFSTELTAHNQRLAQIYYDLLCGYSPHLELQRDHLSRLLGDGKTETVEGKIVVERLLLGADRTTILFADLVELLARHIVTYDLRIDEITEKYKAFGYTVEKKAAQIVTASAEYLKDLPGDIKWSVAVDAVSGRPITAGLEQTLVYPQLLVNGKPVIAFEEVVQQHTKEISRKTTRITATTTDSSDSPAAKKAVKVLRSIQLLNVYLAARSLKEKVLNGADNATVVTYSANLLSDIAGFAGMYKRVYQVSFSRRYSVELAAERAQRVASFFNIVSGLSMAYFEFDMAGKEWRSGDRDAAVGRGMMGAGGVVLAAAALGGAAKGSTLPVLAFIARVARLFRINLLGALLTIGGLAFYLWKDDNPVEAWLAHCCWGKDAYQGKGEIKNIHAETEMIDYTTWEKEPDREIEAVVTLMVGYHAKTIWSSSKALNPKDYPGYRLVVTVPPFAAGKLMVRIAATDLFGGETILVAQSAPRRNYYTAPPLAGSSAGEMNMFDHTWEIPRADLPAEPLEVTAQLWYDPFGDKRYLLPTPHGMIITTRKPLYGKSTAHVRSI